MSVLAADSLEVVFEHLGQPATVTPLTGEPFAVCVLPDAAPATSGFDAPVRRTGMTLQVQVAEWARPVKGDRLTVMDEDRAVADAYHSDDLRLVWTVETEAA